MPKRVVMLKFKNGVTAHDVVEFKNRLHAFAGKVAYKNSMHCGYNIPLGGEKELDKKAPDVTVPSFMAVWDFPDMQSLEAFVNDPIHHEFAGGFAKSMVEHRFVVNIE